jgi:hypothetical protein
MRNDKLQKVNTAISQLLKTENTVRNVIKQQFFEILSNTNENNTMKVEIYIDGVTSITFGIMGCYPLLTDMWLQNGEVYFIIDDDVIEFEDMDTYILGYILNQL